MEKIPEASKKSLKEKLGDESFTEYQESLESLEREKLKKSFDSLSHDEKTEHLQSLELLKQTKIDNQVENDIRERLFEEQSSNYKVNQDGKLERTAEDVRSEIEKLTHPIEKPVEKDYIEIQQGKSGTSRRGLRNLGIAVGTFLTSMFSANAGEKHEADSLKNNIGIEKPASDSVINKERFERLTKITPVEEHKEVAGITLEGRLLVPFSDTTKQVELLKFSGDENSSGEEKIEKIKKAVAKLGYKLGNVELLRSIYGEHGQDLIKKSGGYIIAMDQKIATGDDTKMATSIETEVVGNEGQVKIRKNKPQVSAFETLNPAGEINKYDELSTLDYSGYAIVVYK